MVKTDDTKIIELFFSRSEDAIRQLDIKYGKLLRRIIGGIVDSAEDTDELIDDTYMKLWFSIPPERPRELCAYAVRIARNSALKRLSYRQRKRRDERCNVLLSELEACLPSPVSPENELEGREAARCIDRWLESLPKRERVIFMRRYYAMDEIDSIARDLDMRKNAVSVSLSRSRAKLRQHLLSEDITI